MADRKLNISEELTNRSRRFWYGLSALFDMQKQQPAFVDNQNPIEIPFDNDYILRSDRKTTSVREKSNPTNKCSVKINQKDIFPYCKLLDWYLKESFLNKIKRDGR